MFVNWFPSDDAAPHSYAATVPVSVMRARVEYLFQLYEQLTAPLAASAKPKRPPRRARPTSPPLPAGEGQGEGESVGGPSE